MMTRNAITILMGTTCAALGMAGTAHGQAAAAAAQPAAQTATPDAAAPQNTDQTLQDIVVTARRAAENLQRVPVAATVLNGDVLDRQQVRRATDLQYNSPSLVITPDALGGSSAPVFQLRGQTAPLGTDNTVVTYFADVPVDARVIAAGIYDLASVQILRGPQGTLFGKNSTGGAVLFTPRQADTNSFNGYINANVGNYDFYQLTGAVNVPVVKDVLGIRVSGQIARQDGFVKNLSGPAGNDKHYDAVRLSATLTPGGGFRNDLLVTYFNGKQHLNAPIVQAIGGPALFFPNVIASFARQQQLGNSTIDQATTPNNDDNESYLISNATSYDFGDVTLKNIVGYSHTDSNIRLNATSFPFALVDVSQVRTLEQFSDELQLSGKSFDKNLSWIVGGFYSKQKSKIFQIARLFNPNPSLTSTTRDDYTSKAIYGQATLDLAVIGVRGLKLTGGLRNTWDDRAGSTINYANPSDLTTGLPPLTLSKTTSQVSWTIGADYQVTDKVLIYAASRHSYKAGGFNLVSPNIPTGIRSYAPEELTDIELGVKGRFDLGTVPVRTSLALYRGKYKNIHTQATASCGASLDTIILNAGSGTPMGLEFEGEARLFKALTVSAFYNRTLGKYDVFTIPPVPGCTLSAAASNLAGQNFGNISKDTAGLTGILTIPTKRSFAEVLLTGNVYYRSSRLGNDLRGFQSPLPGYTLLNFRLDFNEIGGSRFGFGAYVKNVTDKTYGLTRNNVANIAGYDATIFGDPRTYGLEATLKF